MNLTDKEREIYNLMQLMIDHSDGLTTYFYKEMQVKFVKNIEYGEKVSRLERKIEELQKELTFKDVKE